MKLIATIYTSRTMDWRIKVDSKPNRGAEVLDDRPLLDTWTPPNQPKGSAETMLIYNPRIALVGRTRYDPYNNKPVDVFIPITLLYAFGNKLSIAYHYLDKSGLYKRDGAQLYMDPNVCQQSIQKLPVYRDSLLITPAIISGTADKGEDLKGVQYTFKGTFAGVMDHAEVRELCEILTHTDIQTYTLILSTFEKLDRMEKKIDEIQETQRQILMMLQQRQDIEQAKIKSAAGTFAWKSI